MARKTVLHKITSEGRDKGKTFLITEMFADEGEDWAMRALLGLASAGIQVPDSTLGMAGLAEVGLKSLPQLKWETLKPLLTEMFDCIQIVADPTKPHATTRPLIREDIEEISTRFELRFEWGKLHLDFLAAVAPSLIEQVKATAEKSPRTKVSVK